MRPIMMAVQAAYEFISDIDRWCQHDWAQDRNGGELLRADPNSVRVCALGAVYRVTRGQGLILECLLQRVCEKLFDTHVHAINDNRDVSKATAHGNVLHLYEYAIDTWSDRDPTWKEISSPLKRSFDLRTKDSDWEIHLEKLVAGLRATGVIHE